MKALMSVKSSLVTIAITPGMASASEVSIDTTRACAYGLRRNFPSIIPGIARSPTYFALPVTLATPSTRGTDVPTTENVCFGLLVTDQNPFVIVNDWKNIAGKHCVYPLRFGVKP